MTKSLVADKRKKNRRQLDPEHPENQWMSIPSLFLYGLQHVLTMYGGIIAVPIIMGSAAGLKSAQIGLLIAACLFIGGIATLIQTIGWPFFGSKLPLVQGVSFAAVSTMLAIIGQANGGINGLQVVFGSVIVAALFGLIIAPFFALIVRFFPPVVTGTVITVIGISLIPVAIGWIVGNDPKAPGYADPAGIGLAALTLAIIVVLSKVKNATISRLSILFSLIIGTIIAAIFGKADFSQVPNGPIAGIPTPFEFGLPQFQVAPIISMMIVILVIMTETTADIIAIGEVVGTKVDSKRIAAGLRADMLSSAISPFFNSFSQSAFAQNVGLVAITKVKSRWVVAAGGVVLLVLGLFPILGRLVAAIPGPVLGGAGIVLFGSVAASGIRTLGRVDYRNNMNLIIVAISVSIGVLPELNHDLYSHFPSWFQVIFNSGISSATIAAVLLNLVFNVWKRGTPKDPSVFAASPTRGIPVHLVETLQDGDRIEKGKVFDKDDHELPLVDAEGHVVDQIFNDEPDEIVTTSPRKRKGSRSGG